MPETKALSTEISPEYKTKEEPKNVKIEIGKTYTLTDGSGTQDVTIESIRKVEDDIIIYFKYPRCNNTGKISDLWSSTYGHGQRTLSTFRAQLLEFGQISSLELIYPTKREGENYYPTVKV